MRRLFFLDPEIYRARVATAQESQPQAGAGKYLYRPVLLFSISSKSQYEQEKAGENISRISASVYVVRRGSPVCSLTSEKILRGMNLCFSEIEGLEVSEEIGPPVVLFIRKLHRIRNFIRIAQQGMVYLTIKKREI